MCPMAEPESSASSTTHPHLVVQSVDLLKGRQVTCAAPVRNGEVVLVDRPFVLVPAMLPDDPAFIVCSRRDCYRRIPRKPQESSSMVSCPKSCAAEVSWCCTECQVADQSSHYYECNWLKSFATTIRTEHGDGNFGLMWMIARMLVARHLEAEKRSQDPTLASSSGAKSRPSLDKFGTSVIANHLSLNHFSKQGWDLITSLDGSTSTFPQEQVGQWRQWVDFYFFKAELPLDELTAEDVVNVFCRVETNSFGLYPGVTGEYPIVSMIDRGEYYGAGIYPTAAMFNHACCPNITHKLDEYGRRIFQANRDIKPGEECCISYFDLAELTGTKERKEEIARNWSFVCACERCVEEGDFELPHFLKTMDI